MAGRSRLRVVSHTHHFSGGGSITMPAGLSGAQYTAMATKQLQELEAMTGIVIRPEDMVKLREQFSPNDVVQASLQLFDGETPKSRRMVINEKTAMTPVALAILQATMNGTSDRVMELTTANKALRQQAQAKDARITNLTADVAQRDKKIAGLKAREGQPAAPAKEVVVNVGPDPRIAELEARLAQAQGLARLLEERNARLNAENDVLRQDKRSLQQEVQPLRAAVRRLAKGQSPATVFAAPHVQRPEMKPDVTLFPETLKELPGWVAANLTGKVVLHEGFIKSAMEASHTSPAIVFRGLSLLGGPWRDMRLESGNNHLLARYRHSLQHAHMDHRPTFGIEGSPPRKDILSVTRLFNGRDIYCDWHLKRLLRSDRTVCLYHAFDLLPESDNRAVFVGFGPRHI